ncbi:MIF4G domain-containing protein (Initiation factor eIF-4 gamma, middle) [Trichoderma parareesei]|uniref:Pre-mRNA-splicing factor CWC22 n=1 Tax=Trichoderma parareesei TaxID=858221 RepID=A0A2H2ZJ36_TRIPA|nr:MIF4G domain-containing protein (Initiation factor eIF-4 gamma, middle) [Trichoderma parareesei]
MAAVVDMPHRERGKQREGGDSYRPSRPARSRSRSRSPPRAPVPVRTEEEKQAAAKAEYEKLLNMRSGGTYIPPARLRALQAQITDKSSKEYQRMAWEALKKSINGLINKVNTANIKHIVPELFGENLVRGRGLFCRSIMKAQAASLPFTPIYAAMAAIVNTKLPQVGELLVKRLIMQFRKGFKRNDKAVCLSSTTFLAHLINQQVQHEMLAGQILLLLLHKPTDDSVEIAVGFCKEVGQYLEEMQPAISMAVFDQFRNILHESDIDKRTQYMIEVLFQIRKDKFKDHPAIKEELDLVEEEDQITHKVELDGEIDVQDGLNIFKYDPEWEEHEEAYKRLKAEILGEASDDEDGDEDEDEDESSEDEENEETKAMEIKDQSNADLVNLRRTIYLTIMSSADPEEAVHKLMKINLPVGQEPELPSMIVECCSQEKTYTKFFGLIGERFAKINRLWCDLFEQAFVKYYETIHRYENNKLRNIAMLFGHMFASDALGWHCLSVIHLNEEETTSSSRIFIKILFQHISEEIGLAKLRARMTDETLRPSLEGLFPRENPRNIRFSINYFTSIGMGVLTEEMREQLMNMPKPALPAPAAQDRSDTDSVSSYSSYTRSSYSSRSRSRSRSAGRRSDHDPAPIPPLLVGEGERRTRPVLPGEEAAGLPAEVEATRRAPHGLRHHGTAVAHEATRIVPTAALHLLHHDAAETQTRPARLREGVDRARAHQAVPQVEGTARLSAAEGPARSSDKTADRRLATIRPGPGRRRDLDRLRRLRVAEGALIRRHAAAARLRAG